MNDQTGEPTEISAFCTIDGEPFTITFRVGRTADGLRPVSVTIKSTNLSADVTSATLRRVPLGRIWQETMKEAMGAASLLPPGVTKARVRKEGPTPQNLSIVAGLYNSASRIGLPPTKTVETGIGLPRPTANRWVRRARDMGLIAPAKDAE